MRSLEKGGKNLPFRAALALAVGSALAGCAISAIEELPDGGPSSASAPGLPFDASVSVGGTEITFVLPSEPRVSELFYQVSGPAIPSQNGMVELAPAVSRASAQLALPTGHDYTLRVFGIAADAPRLCKTDVAFDVSAAVSTQIFVALSCDLELNVSSAAPVPGLDAGVPPGSPPAIDAGSVLDGSTPPVGANSADGGASPARALRACDACRIAVCSGLESLQTAVACLVITGLEPSLASLICGQACPASP